MARLGERERRSGAPCADVLAAGGRGVRGVRVLAGRGPRVSATVPHGEPGSEQRERGGVREQAVLAEGLQVLFWGFVCGVYLFFFKIVCSFIVKHVVYFVFISKKRVFFKLVFFSFKCRFFMSYSVF